MFYLKYKGKKLSIEDDNTFTMCPRCGKEMRIFLGEAVVDGILDLYGTAVYCARCSRKIRGVHGGDSATHYITCPYCGAHLAPGEQCSCTEKAAPGAANTQSGKQTLNDN